MQDGRSTARFVSGAPYRTIGEERILELLLLHGWVHAVRAGARETAMAEARAALEKWVHLGLGFAARGNERSFDPAEVVNFCKWAGLRGEDACWRERFVPNGRRLVLEQHGIAKDAGAAPDPSALAPARFNFELSRSFNLDAFEPGTSIRLRLPLPLEEDANRNLNIRHSAAPDVPVAFTPLPGRLDVRLSVPRERTITVTIQFDVLAEPFRHFRSALTRSERELYLRSAEGLMRITPRLSALAQDLAGNAHEDLEIVRRFWHFLLTRLACGTVHYDALDPRAALDTVLESGWFDCQLGSALIVALCRARGIPARLAAGYLLYPASPFHHYWAEAWVDGGWFPLDSIASDLSAFGQDSGWRDGFFGSLDYRVKTQSLPHSFDASPSLRFPARWGSLSRLHDAGMETAYLETESRALIYRDRIVAAKA